MDVHCTTCGEPWDIYHLRHDAIFETDLSHDAAKAWTELPQALRLNGLYREKFKAIGYEFGRSVYNVIRCPHCPKDAKPDLETFQAKAAVEELLGDDEDGIAVTFEDHRL